MDKQLKTISKCLRMSEKTAARVQRVMDTHDLNFSEAVRLMLNDYKLDGEQCMRLSLKHNATFRDVIVELLNNFEARNEVI